MTIRRWRGYKQNLFWEKIICMVKKRPIHDVVSLVDKQRAEIISNIGNESKTKTCIKHFVKNNEVKSENILQIITNAHIYTNNFVWCVRIQKQTNPYKKITYPRYLVYQIWIVFAFTNKFLIPLNITIKYLHENM